LPVSESLAFGVLPVVARNSSLREAGGDLAVYFRTDDVDSFVSALETNALDRARRLELTERIRITSSQVLTWEDVAATIRVEIDSAERRDLVLPTIELGREYMLAVGQRPHPAAASTARGTRF
jgi:glycosyltransferase involved in cell wall biosynthesis